MPASSASMASAQLVANKAPQPPVTIDLTTFQQLQQQLQTQQHQHQHQHAHRMPALPLSASNSASASVTLSQPMTAWASDPQVNSNIQTLVHSFNRHTPNAANFAQPVSFSAPSPPPQLHSLLPQPHSHALAVPSNADRPPSEVSYNALYYPQSPPASALHTLSNAGFHQPASPLLSSTTYWPIQYDPNSGQQQQYVLKMNGSNIVIPAPMAVAQQPSALVKQEATASIDHSQQPVVTPGRHSACAVCHSAKTSCNGQRPCDRCVRLDRQSLCVDRPRKTPVRSDKKKSKKEDGEPGKDTEKSKKVKREHENGTEEADSKRIKREESAEEESKAGETVKKEPSSLAPPATISTLDSPTAIQRDMSSRSSHSSSDSVSSTTPSSPASHHDDLIDVSTSTLSTEPERRLSTTYLRMHQVYPTRGAIADAIRNGAVTPLQVHFLLSYLSAVLHTDDIKQLLQPIHPSPASVSTPSSLVSPSRPLSFTSLPSDLVSDRGVYVPRFHFNFGCSPLEPVDDNSEGLIDFATLQIIRVDPAHISTSMDSIVSNAAGFGPLDSNGRTKASSPSPPAVPFAASSTSAFTVVPSATASAHSSPAPSPSASSLSSSLSPAKASSPSGSNSSPLTPPSSINTSSTAAESNSSHNTPTSSPLPASATSNSSSSSSSTSMLPSASTSSSILSASTDASTSVTAASTSSTLSSSTTVSSELFLTIRVNREFERLFGYSQPYMRDLFRSEGGKVLYRLLTSPSMPVLSKWLTEALIGERTEFKAVVTIVNRYKGTTECLLNCRWTLDSGGLFRSVAYSFAPLPEKGNSSGRWMKGEV